MFDESHLLTEFLPGLEHPPGTSRNVEEPFFACPVGEHLWHEYRAVHPEAPERPPEGSEADLDAEGPSAPYWDHVDTCPNCNE